MRCFKRVFSGRSNEPGLFKALKRTLHQKHLQMSQEEAVFIPDHAKRAWEHWNKLGAPKYSVAPMVDQFCANDPDVLVQAAQHVDDGSCDYVDLNFGCPQRIAKRGHYGAFLMEDLQCVESLIRALHKTIKTPVSAKIRIFPDLNDTLRYARLLESAGASLVAVHGRTRDQKDAKAIRADWDAIRAVKAALSIPVLGNGDIRCLADAQRLLQATGADGVMSASPLLDDPGLFWPPREGPSPHTDLARFDLALEYLDIAENHPVPMRMVRGHLHKMLGCWLQEHTDIRDEFVRPPDFTVPFCKAIVHKLRAAALAVGRPHPVPKLPERKRLKLEREEALAAAQAEQQREASALAALPVATGAPGAHPDNAAVSPTGDPRPAKQAKVGGE